MCCWYLSLSQSLISAWASEFLPVVLLSVPKTLHHLFHTLALTQSWVCLIVPTAVPKLAGCPPRMTETPPAPWLCNSPHQSHCICAMALFSSSKEQKLKQRKKQWQREIAFQSKQESKTYQMVWTLTNQFCILPSFPGILSAPGFSLSQRAILVPLKNTISGKTSGTCNRHSKQPCQFAQSSLCLGKQYLASSISQNHLEQKRLPGTENQGLNPERRRIKVFHLGNL